LLLVLPVLLAAPEPVLRVLQQQAPALRQHSPQPQPVSSSR
jgi:hypothetical protein